MAMAFLSGKLAHVSLNMVWMDQGSNEAGPSDSMRSLTGLRVSQLMKSSAGATLSGPHTEHLIHGNACRDSYLSDKTAGDVWNLKAATVAGRPFLAAAAARIKIPLLESIAIGVSLTHWTRSPRPCYAYHLLISPLRPVFPCIRLCRD